MTTYIPPSQPRNPHLPFGDQRTAPWYGKDVLSVRQFNREDLEYIFAVAHEMRVMVERIGTFDLLKGKILANLFYEPSTRTRLSTETAMKRLGGSVVTAVGEEYSSLKKDRAETAVKLFETFLKESKFLIPQEIPFNPNSKIHFYIRATSPSMANMVIESIRHDISSFRTKIINPLSQTLNIKKNDNPYTLFKDIEERLFKFWGKNEISSLVLKYKFIKSFEMYKK